MNTPQLDRIRIFSLFVILSGALMNVGCVSMFKSKPNKPKVIAENGLVLQSSGVGKAIYSTRDQKHWIKLKRDSQSARTKMFATLATGDYKKAEKDARAFLTTNPKDRQALEVLCTALVLEREYALAGYYARMLERFHPGTSTSANVRAIALVHAPQANRRDFDQALDLFQQAFDSSSEHIAAGLNLGHLYLELGDPGRAQEVFATAKERCENCAVAMYGHSVALSRLRRFKAARKELKQILAKKPNDPAALYRLALVEAEGFRNHGRATHYLHSVLAKTNASGALKQRADLMLRRLETDKAGELERLTKPNYDREEATFTDFDPDN